MRKIFQIFVIVIALTAALPAFADMTDKQIVTYVQKEVERGTSRQQIVTHLMQNGVSIDRIRTMYNKYQKEQNNLGIGAKDITNGAGKYAREDRMRTTNGDKKKDVKSKEERQGRVSNRRTDGNKKQTTHTYDDEDEEYVEMDEALDFLMPDSLRYFDEDALKLTEGLNEKGKRKVFGRDIFNRKNLSFEPNMNIATPQNYTLGPGDVVNVDIWGASQSSVSETISPDGTIVLENIGPISLGGLTVAQAKARLKSRLGAHYGGSSINLTVGQTKTITVNVMGEVRSPGTYTLSAFASVFHALYMAGGTNDIGTLRNIKVYRGGKLISNVDIYDYILNGKMTGNIRLAEGDVISVGPYETLVNITGKVRRPMFYEMKKKESLKTLLNYAGGFTGEAYKKSVKVIRKATGQYSIYDVNEFDMASFHLDDEDSVAVDSVIKRYSNMVEIKGAVFRPGMYQVGGNINSVRTLITAAGGYTEEAFTNRAIIHRRKADRTLQAIAVDVEKIMNGNSADVALKNEDVLFIPSMAEYHEEQTITIHGEVFFPGVYEYAENTTLEDFVLQAGGLKASASVVKVDVARRNQDKNATTSDMSIAKTYSFSLKDGMIIDGEEGFRLMPFDEVYIRKSPGFSEQRNIQVEGEILFAGTYTLSAKNQRLSDIVKQAGGLTSTAYAKGARLERTITPEERMRMETVLKMAQRNTGKDTVDVKKLEIGNTYFVGIELDKAIANPGSDEDIVLREGDRLTIPEYSGTIRIQGDVMYPNTIAYKQGEDVSYYIQQAGGYSSTAKKSRTYIINMNGMVEKVKRSTKPTPGCEIVVPSKSRDGGLSLPEWLAIGTSTASIATMIATIANLIKK
ncbi:MAG: SLBB domain-containing protein [Prevotella sp.]|nr:SLBB domain-containing protein [Candidatus Equicola faecalis]